MGEAESIHLDYAPRPTPKRRFRKYILLFTILCVVALAAWKAPRFYGQLGIVFQQRKWMNFSAPPERIVLANSFSECDSLLSDPDYVQVEFGYIGSGVPYCYMLAGFAPTIIDPLFKASSISVVREIDEFYISKIKVGPPPTAFLHRRRAAQSSDRLVHITPKFWLAHLRDDEAKSRIASGWEEYSEEVRRHVPDRPIVAEFWQMTLESTVVTPVSMMPGSVWHAKSQSDGGAFILPLQWVGPDKANDGNHLATIPFHLFFGQPDPSDESRFTIDYDLDGKPGRIRGTLRSDDIVTFEILSGSLRVR